MVMVMVRVRVRVRVMVMVRVTVTVTVMVMVRVMVMGMVKSNHVLDARLIQLTSDYIFSVKPTEIIIDGWLRPGATDSVLYQARLTVEGMIGVAVWPVKPELGFTLGESS